VSSYAGFTVRLPPDVKQTLQATAHVTGRPMWHVISESVALYADTLSPRQRQLVRALARLRRDPD
jgi:predicted transcriptional regulator